MWYKFPFLGAEGRAVQSCRLYFGASWRRREERGGSGWQIPGAQTPQSAVLSIGELLARNVARAGTAITQMLVKRFTAPRI